jgi:hypothetical protein
MVHGILDNGEAEQRGYAIFGHYHIPRTPLTLFGLFQQFWPNTKVDKDPIDFIRLVGGVAYQYNEFVRFALSSQNLMYYHRQFTFPASEAAKFPMPANDVPNAVPGDIHAIFLNVEFSF